MYRSLILLLTWSARSLSLNRSSELETRRIVRGYEANIDNYWYVGYMHFDLTRPPTCGSSLFMVQAILTAAHCMVELSKKHGRIKVSFGAQVPIKSKMIREVANYRAHPKYDSMTGRHNLVVAFLDQRVKFSRTVQKIPLAAWNTPAGTTGWSAGWGRQKVDPKKRTDYSGLRSLKATTQILLNEEQCKGEYKKSPVIMCTRSKVGRFYKDDAGNGLIITKPTQILIGVFSHTQGELAYYTSVYGVRHWIRDTVKSLFKRCCNKKTLVCRSVNIDGEVAGNCSVLNEYVIT